MSAAILSLVLPLVHPLVLALAAIVIGVPEVTGAIPLTVLTRSMKPRRLPGTLSVVGPVNPDVLVIGDVATGQTPGPARSDHSPHRRCLVEPDGTRSFQFRGDNNTRPDADLVLPAQIQGKPESLVTYLGYLNNFVNGANKAWIIPIAPTALFAYATCLFVSGLAVAVRTRRLGRAPWHRAGRWVHGASQRRPARSCLGCGLLRADDGRRRPRRVRRSGRRARGPRPN